MHRRAPRQRVGTRGIRRVEFFDDTIGADEYSRSEQEHNGKPAREDEARPHGDIVARAPAIMRPDALG